MIVVDAALPPVSPGARSAEFVAASSSCCALFEVSGGMMDIG